MVIFHFNKLVEGVTDISVRRIHHVRKGICDFHLFHIQLDRYIGLVVVTVPGFVHLMAGAYHEIVSGISHAGGTGVKRDGGIAVRKSCGAQPVPVFIVFRNPVYFHAG